MESETLSFSCPACQSVLRVAAELAGVRGPCPNCHTEIVAPSPTYASPAGELVSLPATSELVDPQGSEMPVSQLLPLADQLPEPQALVPTPGLGSDPLAPEPESILWPPQPRPANTRPPEQAPPPDLQPIDDEIEPFPEYETPEISDLTYSEKPAELSEEEETIISSFEAPRSVVLPRPEARNDLESAPVGWRGALSRIPLSHPALVKYGAPSLLLATIAIGSIKFWPSVAIEIDEDNNTPLIASQPPSAVDGSVDDGGGFSYTGEPNSKTQPITPAPDSRYRPASVLNTDSIESFMADTTGDESGTEASTDPDTAPDQKIQDEPEANGTQPSADDARAVLEKALAADSVEELVKLVLTPERVRPKMELYYGGRSPSLLGVSIDYETSMPLPDSELLNHTFFVSTTAQPMRFPIAIEETDKGLKLDWESFIELHDDLLGKFISSPQSEERTFHLILERRHFFGSDVPEIGSKDCFRISTPIPGSEGYAFVDKDSPTAAVCKPFEWDRLCFPIVTLRWTTPPSGTPYLEITEIVQTSWRAGGDASEPAIE